MKEEKKSKEQLLKELALLREKISILEPSEKTIKIALDDIEMGVQNSTAELKKADGKLQKEMLKRKQAEGTLRKERTQMLSIFDSMNQFIYVVDPATYRILYVNQKLKDTYKKPLKGRICYEEFQGLQSPCEFCTSEILLNNREEAYYWEYHNPVIDRDFFIIDKLIKWSDGRDVRLEIAIDITNQKQAQLALVESEKKYRVLVNNLPGIVFKGYPDWSVDFFDNKIEALTGYNSEDFNSRKIKWSDVIVNEDIKRVKKSFIRALKTDKSYARKYRIKHNSGKIFWVEERGHIVCDDTGKIEYLSGVFFDITEFKQAEKEKKKLENQLLQSQKMEAIGTLTGGISHDFNNLLTTIIGYSEIALDELNKDTPLYDTIEEIMKAGKRAGLLTRQLLAFSRKQVIQPEILNINDILKGTEKMLRRMIGEDIDLVAEFSPELWDVEVDPGQMEQILMNLAVNARDAMPKGGKLTIKTTNVELDEVYFKDHGVESKPGSYVALVVTDSGIGMDEETKTRIFEPFFTTKEMGRGTGLGLSMVYGIVKQNRGYIWAYSEVGQGTTFKIYLPAVQAECESVDEEDKASEDLQKGSETILLVEDEDILRKMVQKTLERQGYRVISASSGSQGLKLSNQRHGPIHLLLTDLIMPGINGKEMSEQIESQRPEIKVIYMSGYADNAVFQDGVLNKEINFIQKPFSSKDLVHKVREVLDQRIDDL